MSTRRNWTEGEIIIAMNLYTRLDFGLFHGRHPQIVAVAKKLGRTPSALALKLTNLAALDPDHRERGISGMRHGSKLDKVVWDRFQEDWERMGLESVRRFEQLMGPIQEDRQLPSAVEEFPNDTVTEANATGVMRRKQQFFRRAVLTSYQTRCCITENPIPDLLIASHILPWNEFRKERLNPANGLCLARTQDAAFDRHLITLDEDYCVVVSRAIRDHFDTETVRDNFQKFEGKRITLPRRFRPKAEFLEHHRNRLVA
jgi:predicted restriction endonuclease